eukprot:TRINITY_DN11202_c0_g2_i1.p1 TRINITY_DN11202_c0_g2~~TRINITY_DN11202_c0_g2_i1.p1  ORF type:complete len:559 (-),score=117.24 TRINITY_DN11202_c0_g2_i1:404-2080(-)
MQENSSYKLVGAVQGTIVLQDCSVGALRREVIRLIGDPEASVKLIAKGKRLQKDDVQLCEYGAVEGCQIMVMKGCRDGASSVASEEQESKKLQALQRALNHYSSGSNAVEQDMWIENQSGEEVQLSKIDRQVITATLLLHHKARSDMAQKEFKIALEELLLCEQGLQLCTPNVIKHVDNVALILLDLVWCSYKLQDINQLGVSVQRLQKIRSILDEQYSERRLLQVYGSTMMVAPVYLRLEMLEGMAAYYAGQGTISKQKLTAAKSRWEKLQVMPEDVNELLSMGFDYEEVLRSLRLAGRDKSRALELIMRQREEEVVLKQREKQRKRQAKFKRTKNGAYVNLEFIDRLVGLGFNEAMAAESLRSNENDFDKALDLLQSPALLQNPTFQQIFNKEIASLAQSVEIGISSNQAGVNQLSVHIQAEQNYQNNDGLNQNTENAQDAAGVVEDNVQNMEVDRLQGDDPGMNEVEEEQEQQSQDAVDKEISSEIDSGVKEVKDEQEQQSQDAVDQEISSEMEQLFENIQNQDPLNIYFDNLADEIETICTFLSAIENGTENQS